MVLCLCLHCDHDPWLVFELSHGDLQLWCYCLEQDREQVWSSSQPRCQVCLISNITIFYLRNVCHFQNNYLGHCLIYIRSTLKSQVWSLWKGRNHSTSLLKLDNAIKTLTYSLFNTIYIFSLNTLSFTTFFWKYYVSLNRKLHSKLLSLLGNSCQLY
jgi:hypothetical protein